MRASAAIAFLTLAACARSPAEPAFPGATCAERLAPGDEEGEPPPAWTPPRSRVVVDVRVETGAILAGLDRAIPRRVVEQRGIDAGPAGRLDVVVDRGPFSVSLAGDDLVLDVDLAGSARVCKPLGPLGCVGWASCDPSAHARAAVRLVLDASLGVPPSSVAIPITRPCTLTALGVDVTARVQREADARARSIRDEIDRGVPIVAPLVRSLWQALAASVPIGAATCARVRPTDLVQSGPRRDEGALAIGLGVEGEVVVETPCRPAPQATAAPPPRLDRSIAPGVSLIVPVVASWEEIGRRVARALAATEAHAGPERVRITDVHARPAGAGVRLEVAFVGRVCGVVSLDGAPIVSASGEVRFDALSPSSTELQRVRDAAPSLDVGAFGRSLAAVLRLPPSLDVAAVPRRLDSVVRALLPKAAAGDPEVTVAMRDAYVSAVTVTSDGLALTLVASGDAKVVVR